MSQQLTESTSVNAEVKDGYDPNMIPAETAARIEREGEVYKSTPDANEQDGIDTMGGYTVSREGLLNNYAVEPEMYYEERGDRQMHKEAAAAHRTEELKEVRKTDEDGLLTPSERTSEKSNL
ncbi:MAG: hypothetical protein ACFCA4_01465 [Cyanophyceae cyanobacterium]